MRGIYMKFDMHYVDKIMVKSIKKIKKYIN